MRRGRSPWLRIGLRLGFCLGLAAMWLAGCAARPPMRPEVAWERYAGLVVPAPVLPFVAEGSALIHYRGERESGAIRVEGTARQAFTMVLSARVIGTTALEVRFDAERLLLLDYAAETYFLGPNDPENRRRAFALDIGPAEFLMALTARVPEATFRAGGGQIDGAASASFRAGEVAYRFDLGPDGLPTEWRKTVAGVPAYRVEYREYLTAETGGAPLRLPRKIRIYTGDGAPLAVLGIASFQPWRESAAEPGFDPAAHPALRYRPLEPLPESH